MKCLPTYPSGRVRCLSLSGVRYKCNISHTHSAARIIIFIIIIIIIIIIIMQCVGQLNDEISGVEVTWNYEYEVV